MEKKFTLRATKKINIPTLMLSEKKILNETKNHNPPPPPPFKLNGRSLRGTPFQKAKIIHKLSVTVYYQKRLSDLDTLIKITITKIISFQHQKCSFNIKLLV